MGKKIELILPKKYGDTYLTINVHRKMKISGLLKTIKARAITLCNNFSEYRSSDIFQDNAIYKVLSDVPNRTLDLIKDYKHKSNPETYIELI
jgi:hypothetical protein